MTFLPLNSYVVQCTIMEKKPKFTITTHITLHQPLCKLCEECGIQITDLIRVAIMLSVEENRNKIRKIIELVKKLQEDKKNKRVKAECKLLNLKRFRKQITIKLNEEQDRILNESENKSQTIENFVINLLEKF